MGLAHDIGKYSAAFQRRLYGSPEHVDHSTAGAAECAKRGQPFAALAVAGHHSGLPNGGGKADGIDQPTLWGRMNKAQNGLLEKYDSWQYEVTLPKAEIPGYLRNPSASSAEAIFFTRMLYSCLVDADFLSTEAFMTGHAREPQSIDMNELEERLQSYIKPWFPPAGELNQKRCDILQCCLQEGRTRKRGLYTLTVPTGGGKTISSLAFAIAQAKQNHMKRIIYVIPYTSIIEQNAAVFRSVLGEEAVLEHHSGVLYDLTQEANPVTIRMAQATENWDMPVVVTTAVQFFESLFSSRSSKCRKLHNMADSVIIFDEAQMLPIPYLRPCIYAISQLVAHFKATAVLCTATQPALASLFSEFLPDVQIEELCPPEITTSTVFRRVSFKKAGKLSWDQLSALLNQQEQVLCVVNSRKGALKVLNRLTGEGVYHLSTLMIPVHREQVLTEIRQRLQAGLPCRVISTSLIEAGVDVDFPSVYREEAGLDSVLQAAGRCNREGKRKAEESFVTIFQAEDPPPSLFAIPIGAGRTAMKCCDDLASAEAISNYFRELLDLKGTAAQDREAILPLMEQELFPFRKIDERFRLIDSPTVSIYVPIGDGITLVQQLKRGLRSRTLFRKLGRFSVSVYEQQFNALESIGALEILEDGSAVLTDLSLYHPVKGLAVTL